MFLDVEACPSRIGTKRWREELAAAATTQTGHDTVIKERVKLFHSLPAFILKSKICHFGRIIFLFLIQNMIICNCGLSLFFFLLLLSLVSDGRLARLLIVIVVRDQQLWTLSGMSCDFKVCEDGLRQTKRMQECSEMI